MASYHVLKASGKGIKYALTVEFHIPIQDDTLPLTGASLRALISGDSEVEKTSSVATPTEITAMEGGQIIKITQNVSSHEAKTNAQMRDKIRATYTDLAVSIPVSLKAKYKGYGFSETEGVEF